MIWKASASICLPGLDVAASPAAVDADDGGAVVDAAAAERASIH